MQFKETRTAAQKYWHVIHQRSIQKREATRPERLKRFKAGQSRYIPDHPHIDVLKAPELLSLDTNGISNTLTFLTELRKLVFIDRAKHIRLDLSACKEIDIAAALTLTAEIERCLAKAPVRIQGNCPHPDAGDAFLTLRDLGYFSYLGTKKIPEWKKEVIPAVEVLRIVSSTHGDGEALAKAGQKLILGNEQQQNLFSRYVYRVLTEAATNSVRHAYLEGHDHSMPWIDGKWWMTGFRDTVNKRVVMVFYDLGLGIPQTLPIRWENFWKDLLNITPNDAEVIKLAMEVRRSRTDIGGYGLNDMKNVVQEHCKGGVLQILSGKGCYQYSKSAEGEFEETSSLPGHIEGTLIIWYLDNFEGMEHEHKRDKRR